MPIEPALHGSPALAATTVLPGSFAATSAGATKTVPGPSTHAMSSGEKWS